jgi:hypothetical protein
MDNIATKGGTHVKKEQYPGPTQQEMIAKVLND